MLGGLVYLDLMRVFRVPRFPESKMINVQLPKSYVDKIQYAVIPK